MRLHRHIFDVGCAVLFALLFLVLSPEARAQGTTVQRLGTASLSAQPGQTLTLAMRFNAAPMAEDYGVFIHFIDSAGVNHAASGADHAPPVPTSRWSGAIAYNHTVTLPASMPRGTYAIRVGLYQTHSPWGRVAMTMGTGVTVDDQLRYNVGTLSVGPATSEILQLANPSLSAQPGQSVTLGMRWNAVPQGQDYYVFVHFVNANGVQQALSGDHLPPVSTATWSGAVAYNRTVTVPTNFPAGQYTIRAGLYPLSAPNSRVTLKPGPGVTVDNETRYTIGTLTVGQPQTTTQVLQLATPSLSAQPGQTVTLGMRWNAVPMSQNYYVFVHFVDANGVQQPLSGDHLPPVDTSVWSGAISYNRGVTVPTGFASGQYTIRVGLYPLSAPNNRVPLSPGPGVTADNETRYIVGTLTVSGGGTPPPSSGGPVGQDANAYVRTFSEEFNSGYDTSRWNDHIWYEASNPTRNYAVRDGVLKIWPQRDASGNFFNRTIDTDGKFQQQYGYFEMEAKLPVGRGVWPAFWLFAHPGDRRPEIDIMEAYPGGGPNSGWGDANLHPVAFAATVWPNGSSNPAAGHRTLQTVDLSAGFHTYAVKWEPGRQTFYFDGQPFYTLNVSMADPMYILLDLWFGSASGTPDGSTPTGEGNSFEVNYVRAWQFKE